MSLLMRSIQRSLLPTALIIRVLGGAFGIAATALMSPAAYAQMDVCSLPVCDIPSRVQEFRDAPQGLRWQWILAYTDQASNSSDARVLKNLSAIAAAIRPALVQANEEDWVIRGVDNIASTALQKLATAEGTSIDELMGYFKDLTSDGVRLLVLQYWRGKIAAATTQAALVELNRFFVFAITATASNESWVHEQATGGADDISARMLTQFLETLSRADKIAYMKSIQNPQIRYNITDAWQRGATAWVGKNDLLLDLNAVLLAAVVDAQGRPDWVGNSAQYALNAVNQILLQRDLNDPEGFAKLFGQITANDTRYNVLNYWRAKIGTMSASPDQARRLNQFLQLALMLTASNESWVQAAATAGIDDLAVAVINTQAALPEADLIAAYNRIQDHTKKYNLLGTFQNAAQAYIGDDAWLVRMNHFLDYAIAHQGSLEDYVIGRASQTLETVNIKLIKSPTVLTDDRIRYFNELNTENARAQIFGFFSTRIKNYNDKASLLGLVKFLWAAYQATWNAGSPGYILASAKNAETSATARLIQLFPVHEGIYQITTGCSATPNGPAISSSRCGSGLIDRVVLMNASSNEGWQLSVLSSSGDILTYWFSDVSVTEGATLLSGKSVSSGSLAEVQFRFDPVTRAIKGWLRTPDAEGYILVTGKQTMAMDSIYDKQIGNYVANSVPQSAILGVDFKGKYGDSQTTVRLRQMQVSNTETTLAGTLRVDGPAGVVMNIHTGTYNPTNGILTLFSFDPTGHRTKLTMAVKRTGTTGPITLTGSAIKTNVTRTQTILLNSAR